MSGARSNVVPMPQGQMMQAPWPMPSGGFPAGCCPPGGMDALLQCYCDIQAATAFISKVVTDLAANDPAFQQALVDAIAASGSNIPLIGVTNGADAQPGQVGEWVGITQSTPVNTTETTANLSLGVLQPGDWDYWFSVVFSNQINVGQFQLLPLPAGFSDPLYTAFFGSQGAEGVTMASSLGRALISVPTLVVIQAITQAPAGFTGPCSVNFHARRMR